MWLRILASCYLLSLGITIPLGFPGILLKVGLPELCFLPLVSTFLFFKIKSKSDWSFTSLDKAIALFIIVQCMATGFHFSRESLAESLSLLYLSGCYYVFKEIFISSTEWRNWFTTSFITAGLLAAGIGIAGYAGFHAGISSRFISDPDCYFLYTGHIIQATGAMQTPNLLFNFLAVIIFLLFYHVKKESKKGFYPAGLLILLLTCLILTFSKSIVLFSVALIYYFSRSTTTTFRLKRISIIACTLLFLVAITTTHFLLTGNDETKKVLQSDQSCYSKESITTIGRIDIYPTVYFLLKKAAIDAGISNPITGIGPGNFHRHLEDAKLTGSYPADFPSFDPHGTFTGVFSESGFTGLAALIWITFVLFRLLKIKHNNEEDKTWQIVLQSILFFICMEAISLDMLQFRHIWILLAATAASGLKTKL